MYTTRSYPIWDRCIWKAKATIDFPEKEEPYECEGYVLIEQQYSGIHFTFCWADKAVAEFFEAAPLAITGQRTKHCALSAIYRYKDPDPKKYSTRSCYMTFEVPGKLFSNRPDSFTLMYSTTDRQHGSITLSRLALINQTREEEAKITQTFTGIDS